MIEIVGAYNTALCYTGELEEAAAGQIKAVCDQSAFADCKIRIMPDVHAGMGCTIGTTMTITDKIVPGMVGVDIGCGTLPKDLAYVVGRLFDDYIHDMKIIQHFAALNRKAMMDVILVGMRLTAVEQFTTIHNYIDTDNRILRKGAVAAYEGQKLLIPINMRDGSLICIGKGNPDWNCSAPHGAGRLMSRKEAFKRLSLDEYRKEMEGIYSTCVDRTTLDEAPMAYKGMDEIISHIGPTVDVVERIIPVYNFKAAE